MYRIHTISLLLILTFGLHAQERKERPLPYFSEEPYAVLKDSIKGWSYSLDGQWVSGQNTIPIRTVSRNTEEYEKKENQLGLDNVQKILAYRVEYGRDTLSCIVKIFKEGYFKYPTRKRGWRVRTNAYYMIVPYDKLREAKNLSQGEVHVLRIPAMDGGQLQDIEEREILDKIKNTTVIREKYDRNLVLTLQLFRKEDKARFQLASLHEIFPDVEGVRQDFTRNGQSLYGSTVLFDFIYFETKFYNFLNLLEIPRDSKASYLD